MRLIWIVATLGALVGAVRAEPGAPPRAARSVHLGYPAPDATAFTIDMAVLESTPGSYFMAAGWNTGYFGLQELADGRKVVIFSVWDPTTGDDPDAVPGDERVECLHQAEGVRIKRFGGEGTGGQCMADCDWQIEEPIAFAVTARAEGRHTSYAGFMRRSADKGWHHLVTFRTRTGGQPLRGLYSFVEDFRRDTKSVAEVRRARFEAAWARGLDGEWMPLRRARFTASSATWEARDSIDALVDGSAFVLATGGDVQASRPLRSMLEAAPSGLPAPVLP